MRAAVALLLSALFAVAVVLLSLSLFLPDPYWLPMFVTGTLVAVGVVGYLGWKVEK